MPPPAAAAGVQTLALGPATEPRSCGRRRLPPLPLHPHVPSPRTPTEAPCKDAPPPLEASAPAVVARSARFQPASLPSGPVPARTARRPGWGRTRGALAAAPQAGAWVHGGEGGRGRLPRPVRSNLEGEGQGENGGELHAAESGSARDGAGRGGGLLSHPAKHEPGRAGSGRAGDPAGSPHLSGLGRGVRAGLGSPT